MTTAIIGAGNIANAIARHLTAGGERVVLAAGDQVDAAALAGTPGGLASAAPVKEAILHTGNVEGQLRECVAGCSGGMPASFMDVA